jgi:hypothetical protein
MKTFRVSLKKAIENNNLEETMKYCLLIDPEGAEKYFDNLF